MATPIDFDGELYDEPIPNVDFRVGAPRTRWGWKRALKRLVREEEKKMAYTGHGHHIPGTDVGTPPSRVARCGGVDMCPRCKADVLEYEAPMIDSTLEQIAIEHGRKCQDLENAMLWDGYKAARQEWMEFKNSISNVSLLAELERIHWAERDRGLTGE